MKKRSLWERIRYRFDCMMSRGHATMTGLLFAAMASIVVLIGVVAYFAGGGSVLSQIWSSLMYTLDAGNLASVPTDNLLYLLLMSLATLCGLILTSVLIGIIATGVESKLQDLRKGNSRVLEEDHTVIVGFNTDLYALLQELTEANANKKNACVVVLGQQPREEMEELIAAHITDPRTTRIICRSGKLHEGFSLGLCSPETSRSVILNVHNDDAEIVKVLLALTNYLKDKTLRHSDLRVIATVQDSQYIEAARIAGAGRAEIIYAKEAVARIIANTCRQHGLSQVLTELFNFSGNELYFEKIPEMVGKTFREATMELANATAVGLYADGKVKLNPPGETVIREADQLVVLEMDDGAYRLGSGKATETQICKAAGKDAVASSRLLILGSNPKLPLVLKEYDQYVQAGAEVVIVDDDLTEACLGTYENLKLTLCEHPVNKAMLCAYLDQGHENILLLNDDSLDSEASDAQTLLRLILLRDIADSTGRHLAITTEMRSVDNQRLASCARVDDFVIGSNFASLLMAQISENPYMRPLIRELLDESGSELYMKPIADYVALGETVDSYTLTESANRKGEIYLGYRQRGQANVVVNPEKAMPVVFSREDQIIVIAEN